MLVRFPETVFTAVVLYCGLFPVGTSELPVKPEPSPPVTSNFLIPLELFAKNLILFPATFHGIGYFTSLKFEKLFPSRVVPT